MDPVPLADTVQATVDTVYVMQSEATETDFPVWLTAMSTTLYFLATCFIFWKTKKQAEATQETVEASKESNEIQKRASFYPTLNVELDSHGLHFDRPYAKITSADNNVVLDANVYGLVEYEQERFERYCSDKRVYEDTDTTALLWHSGVGNVTNKEVKDIETPTRISGVHFLLSFRDALANVYYRYQYFDIEKEHGTPIAQLYGTTTNQMKPAERYVEYAGEDGIYFVPWSDVDDGEVMTREKAKKECPKPVKVFSEKVYSHAAGGLGPIGEALTTQRG